MTLFDNTKESISSQSFRYDSEINQIQYIPVPIIYPQKSQKNHVNQITPITPMTPLTPKTPMTPGKSSYYNKNIASIKIQKIVRGYLVRNKIAHNERVRLESRNVIIKEIFERDIQWIEHFNALPLQKKMNLMILAVKEINHNVKQLYDKKIRIEYKRSILYYLFTPLTDSRGMITIPQAKKLTMKVLNLQLSDKYLSGVNGIFYKKPFNGRDITFLEYSSWVLDCILY